MKYFFRSLPILFLTIFYGLIDAFIIDFSIVGEGSDPPVNLPLKELILYHVALPIIFFYFWFLLYKAITKLNTKICLITIAIYYLLFEVWVFQAIYFNIKV
ncbi:hypothetical protein DVH26_33320 [Paenibacillus sp. H1-7]|nr:hypothetical protein DVH26_33320 [Paenibacillus sp. H1-7]